MFDQLMTEGAVKLAGGVFVLMAVIRHIWPEPFQKKWGQRIIPVLPLVLGVAGAFFGVAGYTTTADKVTMGMIAGFAASHLFKIGKTTVLGWGIEVPTPVPANEPPAGQQG